MRFATFTGGLWLPDGNSQLAVPDDALLQADNLEYTVSGGIRGRRGRTKLNGSLLSGGAVSAWRHYPRTGTPSTLVGVDVGASTSFYHASGTSGTFSVVTGGTGLADALRHSFVVWPAKNKTFMVNGSDAMKEYDGSTIATVATGSTNGIAPKKGPYVTLHKTRLWATDPDELNYSVYASEVGDETEWPAANQLSVNDPQGGDITGLASFFDFLLIFKTTSIFRFIGDVGGNLDAQLSWLSDRGCVAPDTVQVTPFGVFFLGRDGLYITDGVSPSPDEMSRPIRPLFVDRTTQNVYTTAIGRWFPRKQAYVLKLDPTDSEAYVLQRIEILSENPFIGERSRVVWAWSKHTDLPATAMSVWASEEDDGRLVSGDSTGQVWVHDDGTQDDGSNFTVATRTVSRRIDAQGRTGRAYRVKVFHRASVALSGAVRYDQSTSDDVTFSIGEAATADQRWFRQRLNDFARQGRFLSLKLANDTDGPGYELEMADVDVRLRSSRVWRDRNVA